MLFYKVKFLRGHFVTKNIFRVYKIIVHHRYKLGCIGFQRPKSLSTVTI